MTTNIVISELPNNIAKEFTVDEQGKGYVSRRGIARLSGKRISTVQSLLKNVKNSDRQTLTKSLQPFAGIGIEGDRQIPDVFAFAIIQHYAFKGSETAQTTLMALGAIGLRVLIQKTLGWDDSKRIPDNQMVDMLCLPAASEWSRQFPQKFYAQCERLTGLKADGHKRPILWAKITKELIYDYLPKGVYDRLKELQNIEDPNIKLHQYLTHDGLTILQDQIELAIALMAASTTINESIEFMTRAKRGVYQLKLAANG